MKTPPKKWNVEGVENNRSDDGQRAHKLELKRKNKRWNGYHRVTIVDRIKILYDFKVHNLQLDELTQKYNI